MKQVALYGLGSDNQVFSKKERDDGWHPWVSVKHQLNERGFDLVTWDQLTKRPAFEIHVNVGKKGKVSPAFLLAIEPPAILNKNYLEKYTRRFRTVFTWDDDLVDGRGKLKLYYPNPISLASPIVDGYSGRSDFSCIISGNKSIISSDSRELYSERLAVIKWFQERFPSDFKLYGKGWDLPASRPGLLGKVIYRANDIIYKNRKKSFFESYQGKVEKKRLVLLNTRFCFCYENMKGLQGYITEKIFDSFMAGCVPVYWGADNITDYIPKDCFVDRRNFNNMDELYFFLSSMDEREYVSIQKNIVRFLKSDQAKLFSSEYFASNLVGEMLCRL